MMNVTVFFLNLTDDMCFWNVYSKDHVFQNMVCGGQEKTKDVWDMWIPIF